jgi:hypothetical protein
LTPKPQNPEKLIELRLIFLLYEALAGGRTQKN